MEVIKVKAYRLAWTIYGGGRGHVAFQNDSGAWSNPVPLARSEDVAAVAAILRGGPDVYWDTDHAALLCGPQRTSWAESAANLVTYGRLEGGDGPFPRK